MDASDNAREEFASGFLFRNIDLRGRSPAYICNWLSYTRPIAFAALVKAISRGNRSVENKILRLWGIRGKDAEAALSSGAFRFSDVYGGSDDQGCSD